MATIETRSLPMQLREASFAPATANEAARTVELCWTAAAVVRRVTWWDGEFDEELVVDPSAVRMGRLNGGAPLLADHRANLASQVGVVEGARLEGDRGLATVRFSKRADADILFQDVRDGIVRNVSVGYRIWRTERIERDGQVPLVRVVDWEPYEISLVAVPADAGAGVRSEQGDAPCEITVINSRGVQPAERTVRTMEPELENTGATRAAAPSVDVAAVRAEAATAERARAAAIRALGTRFAAVETAEQLVESGAEVEAARMAILEAVAERHASTATVPGGRVQVLRDGDETRAQAVENALLHRANGAAFELSEAGREWRGLSLSEVARDYLKAQGVNVRGMSRDEVAVRALRSETDLQKTTDFPVLLANVAKKTMLKSYELAAPTWRPLARVVELTDFKPVHRYARGTFPGMSLVAEGQAVPLGKRTDGTVVSYALKSYGGRTAITRETIINDDLNALRDDAEQLGVETAVLESDLFWATLTDYTLMGDGKPLFHADHGNVVAAAAPSPDSFAAAEQKMGELTDAKGRVLNLSPAYVIGSFAHKVPFQKALGAITAGKAADFNPYSQSDLTIVTEGRMRALNGGWIMAAAPGRINGIEVGYLQGAAGLQARFRKGFEIPDSVEVLGFVDIAVKAVDHRGFVLIGNPPTEG
ncbi:HK97 family phage prohead protease [Roseomonas sp. GC11]|uniref:prohead protease/major capsid protein fusion protein n=1 Tax=Roseomonas sp. GC11 TaxID=2950546 RepID=UPI00210C034B|nr:prohead protease/major capsid protein fusion protein [Roseomonas sp. GC11]MCQ4160866.1 HK97 family phage prohead protease [Roseomonas sp. GC11]